MASHEEAVRQVLEIIGNEEDMSHVRAAEWVGVSESTIRRWRGGDISVPLRSPAKENVFQFLRRYDDDPEASRRVAEGLAGYEGARELVLDPNLARRVVGTVARTHRRTRLAIVQEFEGAFVEAGDPIPAWLEDLRREVLSNGS